MIFGWYAAMFGDWHHFSAHEAPLVLHMLESQSYQSKALERISHHLVHPNRQLTLMGVSHFNDHGKLSDYCMQRVGLSSQTPPFLPTNLEYYTDLRRTTVSVYSGYRSCPKAEPELDFLFAYGAFTNVKSIKGFGSLRPDFPEEAKTLDGLVVLTALSYAAMNQRFNDWLVRPTIDRC